MNTLTATKRSKTDKLGDIRTNGMIPAVVYGVRVENTMISVPAIDFEKVLKIAGESSTILLDIKGDESGKGASKKVDVLIHEIQSDPIKGFPIHIDFLAIDMNKSVKVNIPIEFTGVAPAEKDGLGVLVKTLHEVEIEALPKDLPHNVVVDLSVLALLDDQIHVESITLPKGVKMITDASEVVALITPIKEEVVEEAPVDLSAIEVEKKGKKDEEGAEAPAEKAE
ncbi:MAG TPA: 50S ribosomal protein L25 [Candidatus Paceibacterota bacterium]|nr:50S ribosomal protein L25 [Candidatus Paceibacterota bacterium]